MTIPKEFIGAVIGPGGKIIQGMQEETGATISIEEEERLVRLKSHLKINKALMMLCA
jgi:polyribonucleotide nucleotidyltransferase